jgi:type III restriction enzyme
VNRESKEFPNAVLVCCPNLTVKERLQVLRPDNPGNYYAAFDLVPVNLRPHLQAGKVVVENRHRFQPESEHKEGDKSYAVVDKGPETPETLARRVLGDLYDRLPIMVLNDEGHHCWRPAPPDKQVKEVDTARKGKKRADVSREEKEELTRLRLRPTRCRKRAPVVPRSGYAGRHPQLNRLAVGRSTRDRDDRSPP